MKCDPVLTTSIWLQIYFVWIFSRFPLLLVPSSLFTLCKIISRDVFRFSRALSRDVLVGPKATRRWCDWTQMWRHTKEWKRNTRAWASNLFFCSFVSFDWISLDQPLCNWFDVRRLRVCRTAFFIVDFFRFLHFGRKNSFYILPLSRHIHFGIVSVASSPNILLIFRSGIHWCDGGDGDDGWWQCHLDLKNECKEVEGGGGGREKMVKSICKSNANLPLACWKCFLFSSSLIWHNSHNEKCIFNFRIPISVRHRADGRWNNSLLRRQRRETPFDIFKHKNEMKLCSIRRHNPNMPLPLRSALRWHFVW